MTLLKATAILLSLRPKILVVHGYSNPACWAGPLLKPLLRYKLVFWFESNEFDKKRNPLTETPKKWFLRFCDQAHVYGKSASEYVSRLGLRKERNYIVQPTVLEELFTAKNVDERTDQERRLIYIGRLVPEKNLGFLLDGIKAYTEANPSSPMTLSIVGFGPLEHALKRQAEELGLCDRVTFHGRTQQDLLPAIIAAASMCLCSPALYEPYGLVVLESMFVGLPALVSSRCGCRADLITDATGWTLDPGSPESLLEALKTIDKTTVPELRRRQEAARVHAAGFTTARSVDLTMAALLPIIRSLESSGAVEKSLKPKAKRREGAIPHRGTSAH